MKFFHHIYKHVRHFYHHTVTKQWCCDMFGTFGMYFEMLVSIPYLIIIHYLIYHKAAVDCMTIVPWICGPDLKLYKNIGDYDVYRDETQANVQRRETKLKVTTWCGKSYMDYLSKSMVLNGTEKEKYAYAGELYWQEVINKPDETFKDDFLSIMTLWLVAASISLVLNGFLVLASKMKGEGDRRALWFVLGATIIPILLITIGVIYLQHAKYCIFDFAVPGVGMRKIILLYFILRLILEAVKSYCIWRLIREVQDKEDYRLKVRNERFNSQFYHDMGVEAELHFKQESDSAITESTNEAVSVPLQSFGSSQISMRTTPSSASATLGTKTTNERKNIIL